MRPGKKHSSAFLTALLCAVALMMVACSGGGTTSTPPAVHTKAAQSQQILISGAHNADILIGVFSATNMSDNRCP